MKICFPSYRGCIINYYTICQHEQLFIKMMDSGLSIKIGQNIDTFALCCSGPWLKNLKNGAQFI